MTLNFNSQTQLMDHWCWAAVASSVANFYHPGSKWTQGALAGKFVDETCSVITSRQLAATLPNCDRIQELSKVLAVTGNKAWQQPGMLSLAQIQGQVSSGWPLCCEIHWGLIDVSHYITIYGFNGSELVIGDPESGVHPVDYYNLINGYRQGKWINTIGTSPVPVINHT